MKKCPNCDKEFPDSMRFCQTDGTPLVEIVEEIQAEDPLKTTVVRQEDFASSIPDVDPFKTVVGGLTQEKDDDDELLQLPQEFDPMKTMVAPPSIQKEKPILEDLPKESPKFDAIKDEIKAETPPFSAGNDYSLSKEPPIGEPEPPKFDEPKIPTPNFSGFEAKDDDKDGELPATMIQSPFDMGSFSPSEPMPFPGEDSKPKDMFSDSPFSKPSENFETPSYTKDVDPAAETEVKPTYDAPSSPFDQSSSPFDSPKPSYETPPTSYETPKTSYEMPQTSYETPKTNFEPPKATFQEPETSFGGGQFNQVNEPSFGNQPLQQAEWTPPPAPDASWQNQGVGQNTPFQPPTAMAGQNQTLPIISLVLGICSICCYISLLTGPAALITGYLGMKNANENPQEYGGKGLAIAGMIVGGVIFALVLLYVAFWLLVWFGLVGASILSS